MPETIREAIAVFDDLDNLESTVYELETHGFDRAAFSVLASEHAAAQKLGHRYEKVQEVEDDPKAPRATFFSHISRLEAEYLPAPALAAIGVLALAGTGTLPVLIAAGGGALIGALLGGLMHQQTATRVHEQLDRGGLLLWVNLRDAHEEEAAMKILRSHSAHDVHVHTFPIRL